MFNVVVLLCSKLFYILLKVKDWGINSSWYTHRNVLWQALFHLYCSVIYLHTAPCHKLDHGGTILWVQRGWITVTITITITCD